MAPGVPRVPGSLSPAPGGLFFLWADKAGSSTAKTKIFPGSLYLLIFQFLAAALRAGEGAGRTPQLLLQPRQGAEGQLLGPHTTAGAETAPRLNVPEPGGLPGAARGGTRRIPRPRRNQELGRGRGVGEGQEGSVPRGGVWGNPGPALGLRRSPQKKAGPGSWSPRPWRGRDPGPDLAVVTQPQGAAAEI